MDENIISLSEVLNTNDIFQSSFSTKDIYLGFLSVRRHNISISTSFVLLLF